ncbi:pH-dependent sodium/proton antiporter [bacteria symbiont BFo1 of Frankliniella occidentalis]|jgi:NhaA family Na+:H+ antiporter|uniref:Na+/H+ antiporter NhaA n=1 Tax=Erwinia aphidicola TaxID=68334 RepID=UPI00066468A6|nr:Na+/H+ antiporter NhaA [uncultured Erwinia sp.]KMV72305.1 pH-dependent sodium/proton antiporter [bacteria symbiont BFo1 of Frankliniella occidentalis]KYP86206.1 pH-dependent sodium/proton antiporter [bacteria symbiont BFo1 of Frankliniella occidentalis]KYP91807.1 pH-dependent sodium/proton antiporter [bacteria symbiont BFo1 of Frankliniella occidentalis]PIJ58904.1 Na+/H+ antiporter NhaA [Erwinia sp. OLMDLW33]
MNLFLKKLLKNDATGGVVLIVAAAVAMFLANNASTQQAYQAILAMPVQFRFGALDINKDLLLWINDALMALFFLMIGLEVKRELLMGSLKGREKAMFPLIAALGGMVAPGLIYAALNHSDELAIHGWAIPAATDIAFALGILALLGSRVPAALKMFLMALAVIDDLGAIVIIAFFYTHDLSLVSLGVAAASIAVLVILNLCGVRKTSVYLLVGMVLWVAVLKSGVHATLAGVIVGLLIPLKKQDGHSPSVELEHGLHPWVSWLILPLFAFANAGVSLTGVSIDGLFSMVPLGIILGLLVGKPLGITLICWLSVKLKIAALPENTKMVDIAAVGVLCGIGFTMSIFIASLAFDAAHEEMVTLAKLGILSGSVLSAVLGYVLLYFKLRPAPQKHA